MKQNRVLITGAGGFVGSALARGFADLGWSVIGLDRAFDAGPEHRNIRRVTAELTQGVPEHVPDVDLVVHAAWVTTDAATLGITRAEYMELNLRPLMAVLDFAARTSPAAFVFLSSSGVFGPDDAVEGLTDAHHSTGTSPYAAAKRAGEVLVREALDSGASDSSAKTPGTAVHVVRLGYLFGPVEVPRPSRAAVSLVARWLTAALAGRPLEVRADDPIREWTFAPDLAAALERVVDESAASHPIHLGSPHVYSDSALAAVIAGVIRGVEMVAVPAAGRVKPPMVPSDLPALRDFAWTDLPTGIKTLLMEAAVSPDGGE